MISDRVLVASIVGTAFLILTITLFVAKKRWQSLDIPAIISAVAGVAAVIGATLLTADASTPDPVVTRLEAG